MRVLSSPRARRRLAWVAGIAVALGAAAALFTLIPTRSGTSTASEQLQPAAYAAPAAPRPRRLTPADRRAIDATLDRFVPHAVARRDVGKSYELATANLRGGLSRHEWARGSIGVYPYPAHGRRFHGWTVDESTTEGAWIQLLLHPRPGAKIGPIVFNVSLKRVRGKWLVDSFIPAATFAPAGGKAKVTAIADFSPQPQGDGHTPDESRLGHAAAVIPFAVLGLVLLWLIGWAIAARVRDRRLARAYATTKLAPLPRLTMGGDDARARPAHEP